MLKIAGEAMIWILFVLAFLLLLCLLFIFVPVHVTCTYTLCEKKQFLKLCIKFLGIPIPLRISLNQDAKKDKKKKEEKPKQKFGIKRFIAFSKELYAAYQMVKDEFKELLLKLKQDTECKAISFTVHYGTENPALTGILNGAAWTAGTLILKVLDSMLGVPQKKLHIYPNFQKELMEIEAVLTLRVVVFKLARFVLKLLNLVKIMKQNIKTEI